MQVVLLALLCVRQDFIGLVDLSELFLGVFLLLRSDCWSQAVGVGLQGPLLVGFTNFFSGCGGLHFEGLIEPSRHCVGDIC